MHYMLMPLDQHYDGGLGATGDAFEVAAETLAANAHTISGSHPHLPINFLYRHAIELFLKSMIVVLHRALLISYGENSYEGPPFVLVDGKWKPLNRVHSIATLWSHVQNVIRAHSNELADRCRTDWTATPDGLDAAIAAIEAADAASTFFRYPDRRNAPGDQAKSSWKARTPADILAGMHASEGKLVKAFVIFGDDDEILESFQYDDEPLAELSGLLAETAKTLSGAHTGLRIELAQGF